MADQTNPWGSAPSTDSAAQAADAWGGEKKKKKTKHLPTTRRRSRNSSISWIRSIRP